AAEVDSFFYFILWLSVFFFVLIVGGMAYFIWKYRERPGYRGNPEAEHNTPLEITWTVLPTFIVIYIFVRGA
ncbi:MAG: cytochrome c oxidase subunit II transmembrane domain-containing protein, partial [Pirellulaceae bacterium]